MTRNQWLILGSLVICLIVCVSVLSFLLGAYVFQRPNSIAASNPTSELREPANLLTPTLVLPATTTRPDSALTPSRVYRLNDVVTDQGWEYTVTKVEKFKTFTTRAVSDPFKPPVMISSAPAQGIYVGVYFTLKNISKQNAVFPNYQGNIEIVDATGTRYDRMGLWFSEPATPAISTCPNYIMSYVPGITSQCKTIFDVNPSATGLKLNLFSSSIYVALE